MNEKTESMDRKNRQKVETEGPEAQLLLQCKKVNKVMMKITGCV